MEHAGPDAHRRLADDVDDVTDLQKKGRKVNKVISRPTLHLCWPQLNQFCWKLPSVSASPCHTGWERNRYGPWPGRRTDPDRSRPPPASGCLADRNRWTHWWRHLKTEQRIINTQLGLLRLAVRWSGADTHWRSSGRCKDSLRSCSPLWRFSRPVDCSLSRLLGLCLCHPPGQQKGYKKKKKDVRRSWEFKQAKKILCQVKMEVAKRSYLNLCGRKTNNLKKKNSVIIAALCRSEI